jgi:uncharacterized Fe-S cluster protein YjdI
MSKPVQSYESAEVTVTFDPNICTHAAKCVKGLPTVFNIRNNPWISPEAAPADVVEAQVAQCPSGALRCQRK